MKIHSMFRNPGPWKFNYEWSKPIKGFDLPSHTSVPLMFLECFPLLMRTSQRSRVYMNIKVIKRFRQRATAIWKSLARNITAQRYKHHSADYRSDEEKQVDEVCNRVDSSAREAQVFVLYQRTQCLKLNGLPCMGRASVLRCSVGWPFIWTSIFML